MLRALNILKKSVFILVLLNIYSTSLLAIDSTTPDWQAFPWKKLVEKQGIMIEASQFGNSKFTAVKSSMLVKARLNDVANLVLFVDGCHEKSTVCERIEKVRFIDQTNYYQYVVSKFPWPLKKRDIFLKIRIHQEKNTGIVIVKGKSYQDEYVKNKRYIRINDMDLQWKLIPQNGGGVLIEHYIHSDPGGAIPAWLFNDAVTSTPLATLGNIKRLLSLPKYQNRDVAFIEEFVSIKPTD